MTILKRKEVSKGESKARVSLWTELNIAIGNLDGDFLEIQVKKIHEQALMVLDQVASFVVPKVCDTAFSAVEQHIDDLLESFRVKYSSYSNILVIEERNLEIEALGKIDVLTSWSNTVKIIQDLKSSLQVDAATCRSGFLEYYLRCHGISKLNQSDILKRQQCLIQKSTAACQEWGKKWAILGLPMLSIECEKLSLVQLHTIQEYVIKFCKSADSDTSMFPSFFQKIWTGLYVYASCLEFLIKTIGYSNVPKEYKDSCIYAAEILMKYNRQGFKPADPHDIDSIIQHIALYKNNSDSCSKMIGISFLLRILLIHFVKTLAELVSTIENFVEYSSNLFSCGQISLPDVLSSIIKVRTVSYFFLTKRNSLYRSVDNCIRYRLELEIVHVIFQHYKMNGYVRVIFESCIDCPEITIFCMKSVANDKELLVTLIQAVVYDTDQIDTAHVIMFHSESHLISWDGEVQYMTDHRVYPSLFSERYEKGFIHVVCRNVMSVYALLNSYTERQLDSFSEFPPRSADKELASEMYKLDASLISFCKKLIVTCQKHYKSPDFLNELKIGHQIFNVTAHFTSNICISTRIRDDHEFKLESIKLCEMWLEFLSNGNNQEWINTAYNFMEVVGHMFTNRIGIDNRQDILDSLHVIMKRQIIDKNDSKPTENRRTELRDWDHVSKCKIRTSSREETIPTHQEKVYDCPVANQVMVVNHYAPKFRWQRLCLIGSGTFGNVFEVINIDTDTIFALKEMRNLIYEDGTCAFARVKKEFEIVSSLNHPNIIKYYALELSLNDGINLFMEYCEAGSLSRMMNLGPILDPLILRKYSRNILEGLAFLHSKRVVHRDLKPDNVMMNCQGCLKLVDFGTFLCLGEEQQIKTVKKWSALEDLVGTPAYMAPEIIRGLPTTEKVDIWSFGCTLLHLVTGHRPWKNYDNDWSIIYILGSSNVCPGETEIDHVDKWTQSMIRKCLTRDPNSRPSAVELLHDPYLSNL